MPNKKNDPTTVTLKKDKDTKNTVRFTTQDGPVTGSLYVRKDDDRAKQDTITIQVEVAA